MSADGLIQDFYTRCRRPGESLLAWNETQEAGGEPGLAVLTDRRLGVGGSQGWRWVGCLGDTLRYAPTIAGDLLTARFETDEGPFEFVVRSESGFDNFLGNLADMREAMALLDQAGVDRSFVSPAREGNAEGVSAVYQLMRLKELLNQGVLGEAELAYHRLRMVGDFCAQAAGNFG